MKKTIIVAALTAASVLSPAVADDLTQAAILGNQVEQFIQDFSLQMDMWSLTERQIDNITEFTTRLTQYGETFNKANSIAQLSADFYRTGDQIRQIVEYSKSLGSMGIAPGSVMLGIANAYEMYLYRGYSLITQTSRSCKSLLKLAGKSSDQSLPELIKVLDEAQTNLADGLQFIKRDAQESIAVQVDLMEKAYMDEQMTQFRRRMPKF